MLEPPPDVQDEQIIACLEWAYGLAITEIDFLPLGADFNTAVYRVTADNAKHYFLKLRRDIHSEATVTVPHWLAQSGMQYVIPHLVTLAGSLWAELGPFKVILYPFVSGRSGWDVDLSEHQWVEFGATMHELHTAVVPATLTRELPRETFTAKWRGEVMRFLRQASELAFEDPIAQQLAILLEAKHETIHHIVARAEQLAGTLVQQRLEPSLCHGDIHAGNILVDTSDRLYLVDWDTLVMAPKERDLMFIGGGIGGTWNQHHEAAFFYQGYGQTAMNQIALTYYRYERIVQDIAETCQQLLSSSEGGDDRSAILYQFASQFEPNNVVDIAYATDQKLYEASKE